MRTGRARRIGLRGRAFRARAVGFGAALAALACAPPPKPPAAAAPRPSPSQVQVRDVDAVGPYLEASLQGRAHTFRFLFPPTPECLGLIREGATPQYRLEGSFGVVRDADGHRCEPVGVTQLPHWRDAQPRRRSRYLSPRTQAAFRPVHADERWLLLRGRFPLLLELRWPDPMDAVVVLPATPACRDELGRSTTTMEFRAEGDDVFLLDGAKGPCPIVGLALPWGDD